MLQKIINAIFLVAIIVLFVQLHRVVVLTESIVALLTPAGETNVLGSNIPNKVRLNPDNLVYHSDLPYNSALSPVGWGVANPAITQSNIDQTICNPHWSTKSIRPPVSYTNKLKAAQIKEFAYPDTNLADDEEDHIISLELGGSPTDPKNLWPEPYNLVINGEDLGARIKDRVENYLHKSVCSGNIPLKDAQTQISTDWVAVLHSMGAPAVGSISTTSDFFDNTGQVDVNFN